QDGLFASPFTGVISQQGNQPSINTFTDYKGLIRSLAPGRYYFLLFAPRSPVNTSFTVTSTITTQTPPPLVLDTPSTATSFNAVRSNVFVHAVGTEPWQVLSGGTANV